jgi:pyruvate/2-oxoacid:ferredoxin oxidoreductase beta subunit
MTINIEYQDQNGNWHWFQEKHNAADAYRVGKNRAESTKKRHRLMDGDGHLMDLIEP